MTLRIGSGPTLPPTPAPRRSRWPLFVGGAVVVVVLAAAAAVAGILTARHDTPRAAPSSSPSAPSALGKPATCLVMVPLLTDAAKQMEAVYKNPDRDTADLAATAAGLRTLAASAPQDWRTDIVTQYTDLQAVVDAHGDRGRLAAVAGRGDAWLAAALRLAEGCKPYAVG